MQEDMMEYLVAQKRTGKQTFIQIMCLVILSFFVGTMPFFRTISIAFAVIWAWITFKFIFPRTQIEYEYEYFDKIITVEKILGQKKRKKIKDYELDRCEFIAPLDSPRWADYKNRNLVLYEYWSLEDSDEHKPYGFVYGGNMKIVLDLPIEFVKILQNNAPRKVFTD